MNVKPLLPVALLFSIVLLAGCGIGEVTFPLCGGINFSCGDGATPTPDALEPAGDQVMILGDTIPFWLYPGQNGYSAQWTSSTPAVELSDTTSVLRLGQRWMHVAARGASIGQSQVSVSRNGVTLTRLVQVISPSDVKTLQILPRSIELKLEQQTDIGSTASMLGGRSINTGTSVVWSVSDPSIIGLGTRYVEVLGELARVVTGLHAGRAMLRASLGAAKDSVEVLVTN